MLSEKFNKGEEITLKDILDAVLKEDVLAIEILESVGHTLGKAIAGLINMFNPEMIVIGGLLSVAGESLMLPVRTAVNKYSLMLVYKDTQIKLSTLGERAGVIGACLLARSKALGFY
jgi:predicted NBD/HSP70 family sugar kinase